MDFKPTSHPPGTPEKIAVMPQRVENGLPIHHKDDVSFESGDIGGHSCRWLMGDGIEVRESASE